MLWCGNEFRPTWRLCRCSRVCFSLYDDQQSARTERRYALCGAPGRCPLVTPPTRSLDHSRQVLPRIPRTVHPGRSTALILDSPVGLSRSPRPDPQEDLGEQTFCGPWTKNVAATGEEQCFHVAPYPLAESVTRVPFPLLRLPNPRGENVAVWRPPHRVSTDQLRTPATLGTHARHAHCSSSSPGVILAAAWKGAVMWNGGVPHRRPHPSRRRRAVRRRHVVTNWHSTPCHKILAEPRQDIAMWSVCFPFLHQQLHAETLQRNAMCSVCFVPLAHLLQTVPRYLESIWKV
mmetsp:Transcript_27141/g.71408  ORF Transcript_27141/g.71408 Transcript_27141/m.71408 type:complete len:290 (+) Transcript_27141:1845-2714(+)